MSEHPSGGCECARAASELRERGLLRLLLAINAAMFVVEGVVGWWAQSTGLLADALDMLADAGVYGVALYAVGRGLAEKRHAARLSGWLQIALALGLALDVARRVWLGSAPEGGWMMAVAALALVANLACVALLARHRQGEVHLRASWIFSRNDALANLGVILAGVLVAWSGSRWPDLVIGAAITALVLHGGLDILRQARLEANRPAPAR